MNIKLEFGTPEQWNYWSIEYDQPIACDLKALLKELEEHKCKLNKTTLN